MPDALGPLLEQHAWLLGWLFSLSLALFVLGVLALPIMLVRLQPDALRRHLGDTDHVAAQRHPVRHAIWLIFKNTLGAVLAVAGLAMLVLPGQGLLALVVALALLDVPGKHRVERRLLRSPRILRPVNRLRQRFGRPPLLAPDPPRDKPRR